MILIIGGAYMGKLAYAKKEYNLAEEDICDLKDDFIPDRKCYCNLQTACRNGLACDFPADAIVIADEIGSGVVPIDASDRAYREKYGQLLQKLASQSDHVVRIFCGIPEVLK